MSAGPPTDEEIARCLEETMGAVQNGTRVAGIERVPYPYATSYPLEEVTARLGDGRTLRLILKDLTWDRLLGEARRTKPSFLYEPRRCIETYRRILPDAGVGATCHGTFTDDVGGRYWLLIEKVPGVELWQIGDFATWESVARWLGRFHQRFAAEGEAVAIRNPYLLRYGPDHLRIWPARAMDAVAGQEPDAERRHDMARLVAGYDRVVERLACVPPSFIHGELYASNVLVGDAGDGEQIWPVDWEMAGVGPPLLDLAALTAGWAGEEQVKLVDAYLHEWGAAGGPASAADVSMLLDCCRLHYALQWLGWSPGWSPPAEHARDWVSEALRLAERIGL